MAATNNWTGVSNTFEQIIYANIIRGIGTNTLTIGSSTSVTQIGMVEIDGNNIDCVTTLGDLNIGISNAGRLNIGGQSPTVFGGGTRITTNVIDTFSGFLTLGSSSSVKSFIISDKHSVCQNADRLNRGWTLAYTFFVIHVRAIFASKEFTMPTCGSCYISITAVNYNVSQRTLT